MAAHWTQDPDAPAEPIYASPPKGSFDEVPDDPDSYCVVFTRGYVPGEPTRYVERDIATLDEANAIAAEFDEKYGKHNARRSIISAVKGSRAYSIVRDLK